MKKSLLAQKGTTLVVSLIILLVLTVLGITGMEQSGLDMKMVAGYKDRSSAFEAAEVALSTIEQNLLANPPHPSQMQTGCSGTDCFKDDCTNGFCFDGSFEDVTSHERCSVSQDQKEYWKDDDIWNTTGKHNTLTVSGIDTDVKYIVEFLCFTPVSDEVTESNNEGLESGTVDVDASAYAHLYRISTLAKGNGGRANVLLQSYYRIAQN